MKLKKVELDELELYLELLKSDRDVNLLKCSEISEIIRNTYGVHCTEQDIYLLHEPTICEDIYDVECFYRNILG
jgi:hypothetical protein